MFNVTGLINKLTPLQDWFLIGENCDSSGRGDSGNYLSAGVNHSNYKCELIGLQMFNLKKFVQVISLG